MSKIRIGKTFVTAMLILSMLTAILSPCFAAASTSTQVVKNAQGMYDNIKEHHGGISGYVSVLNTQKLNYQKMLNEAAFYNEVYDTIIDFGSTGIDLICSIVSGGSSGALKDIPDQVMTVFLDELVTELPKLTIEEYIYSQAKAGLAQVNLSELMDIGFKIENECGGKVSSVADAIRFIRVNQEIKMGFAALHMGRSLYYEQLNASPWDALWDMFTKHSLSYVSEKFGAGVLEQYTRDVTTEKVYELFTLLIDAVGNPHYTTYMNSVIEISKETEALISYTVDDFGKEPPASPGAGTPEQSPSQTPPSVETPTYVECYYHGSDYNEGYYKGEMLNGKPHGWGKIVYDDFEDGLFYALKSGETVIKALSYEGNFVDGFRMGYGTVTYESGYRDEGTFNGVWTAGKVTFEGKRWYNDEGYWLVTERAVSAIEAKLDDGAEWVSTRQRYAVTYHANGGQNAPAAQEKTKDIGLALRTDIPVRTGYSFLGWSTNASAASADYQPGDLYTANSDATLYAVWKKIESSTGSGTAPSKPNAFQYSTCSPWAKESVTRAFDMGILPDYMLKDYSATATRIDFVRLAYAVIEQRYGRVQQVLYDRGLVPDLQTSPKLIFMDVPQYCGYDVYDQYRVATLNALGIVNGVGDGRFSPNRAITREEAAVMLNRLYAFLQWGSVSSYTFTGSTDYLYVDNDSISNWAFYDVYNMRAVHVMNGVGSNRFAPQSGHTVEESVVTFVRILDLF